MDDPPSGVFGLPELAAIAAPGGPAGQHFLLAAAAILAGLLVAILFIWRAARQRRRLEAEAAARAAELEGRLAAMFSAQGEMAGRMATMAEMLGSRQAELNRNVSERLDGLGHRLNQSVGEASKNTHESLKTLHERLAVLDAAQQNISDLAGQVTTLSNILGNKQSRGLFGQGRMEAIVSDHLPPGTFAFQFTLSCGHRPDCVVHLPNGAPPLVIDAKFPLEGYNAVKAADSPEALKAAQAQFRTDLIKHVKDIKDRYLVPGETHDTAFMFVPSESVFAEIHERFDEVVQRAYRARVVIVSPSLLLLSIQVIQAVLRDARMREQAHIIQDEVLKLIDDVRRLDERANKLATHFRATQKDVDDILVSTKKVTNRGDAIKAVQLGPVLEQPLIAAE
jgi:DNA recombination protein RmuC